MYDDKPAAQRPSTLALTDTETARGQADKEEDAMLRVWQDKLKRRGDVSSVSCDIDAALAEIARSGEDLQRLSRSTTGHRSSRLPVSQPPPPVVAVTNTVLSPVMQESRPREPITVLAERAVTSRERHRSMIDPSQVKEAVRLTSSPPSVQVNQEQESRSFPRNGTSCDTSKYEQDRMPRDDASTSVTDLSSSLSSSGLEPEKNVAQPEKSDPRDRSILIAPQNSVFRGRFVPDTSTMTTPPSCGKGKEQELNDEGFEETQSLVSETLSQETSSGNYETDTHDSTRCSPAELGYGGERRRRRDDDITPVDDDDDLDGKLLKPRGMASRKNVPEKSSFLPKRTIVGAKRESTSRKEDSLKRSVAPCIPVSRNEVERSGSRSSLRSSRSSLNSATSVNTVRNMAPSQHAHLRSYTSAIRALTNDLRKSPSSSPLPPRDIEKRRPGPRAGVSRIPASRSSSSGSSVGPAARNVRKASTVGIPCEITILSFTHYGFESFLFSIGLSLSI